MTPEYVEKLWDKGHDTAVDDDMNLLNDWMDLKGEVLFKAGTNVIEDIWTWFDYKHPKGVAYLLYERKEFFP